MGVHNGAANEYLRLGHFGGVGFYREGWKWFPDGSEGERKRGWKIGRSKWSRCYKGSQCADRSTAEGRGGEDKGHGPSVLAWLSSGVTKENSRQPAEQQRGREGERER